MRISQRAVHSIAGAPVLLALLGAPAFGQLTYSIDYSGPTISMPDSLRGIPITEADILSPGPLGPVLGPALMRPTTTIPGGAAPWSLGLALYPPCVGHPPGVPCGVEVDALSYGVDVVPFAPVTWWFSVDEYAIGGIPGPVPDVTSEGASAIGALEAAADVFVSVGPLPPGPIGPMVLVAPNYMALDGNGFRGASTWAGPGLALIEWIPPMPPMPAQLGDNLDALDLDLQPIGQKVYFSLDSFFPDPLTGLPNTGSAMAHGFVGGDVLVASAGGPPLMYAPAVLLGLDRIGPPDHDDLDALVVFENGLPGYQPSQSPYDWNTGQTDCVLFSVRRGSLLIGAPDSIFGAPIQPGDVLTTPLPAAMGGLSPFPGLFMPAEALGLASSRLMPGIMGDELDALDVEPATPVLDCNANGVEDATDILSGVALDTNRTGIPDSCDIALGASWDANGNTVPDESEFAPHSTYCVAKVNTQGCTPIIGAFGTASVTSTKPFFVSAVDVISNKQGILYYGYAPGAAPWKGGTKCVTGPTRRTPIQNSGGVNPPDNCSGVFMHDFNVTVQSGLDPMLVPGVTVYGQYWYRDPTSSFTVGLSDGIQVTVGP